MLKIRLKKPVPYLCTGTCTGTTVVLYGNVDSYSTTSMNSTVKWIKATVLSNLAILALRILYSTGRYCTVPVHRLEMYQYMYIVRAVYMCQPGMYRTVLVLQYYL